jgi:hypothetical protein
VHRTCPVNYSGANSRSWRVPKLLSSEAPDSPVNYSGAPLDFPEGEEFSVKSPGAPDTVRWCTGQSGAPDQGTLRLSLAFFVEPNSWSFYWLSVNLWHLYNLYTRAKLVSPIICVGQFNHQNQLGNMCKPNSLSGADLRRGRGGISSGGERGEGGERDRGCGWSGWRGTGGADLGRGVWRQLEQGRKGWGTMSAAVDGGEREQGPHCRESDSRWKWQEMGIGI